MRQTTRALALAVLPLVALVAIGCTSDDDAEAATPKPFVPVSRAVETEAGVLVVARDNIAASLSRAVRLDAGTLEVLDGEVPMHHGGPIDPTGQWVAVFGPRGNSQLQNLWVYDLDTWELAWSLSGLPPGELSWQESGLYHWGEHCEMPADRGACHWDWNRGLWRLAPQGAEQLVDFDFASFADSPVIGQDGSKAYVVGMETDYCCGIAPIGEAFLAILDLEAGEVTERVPLPDLLIGQPGHWLGSTEHLFKGQYRPGLAVSPDGSRAYVVHSEVERVDVIDLEEHRVSESHRLDEDDSAVSRLGGWIRDQFARTASGKTVASYLRNVALTPDGRYLLISGSTVDEKPEDVARDAWLDSTAAGLIVVDVLTMEVVYRDEVSRDFRLSPNGYSVLAWGPFHWGAPRVGLTILDLRTMDARHLFPGELVGEVLASPDGVLAYARFPDARQAGRLVAIDLATGEVVAEHPLEQRGDMDFDWPSGLEFSR